MKHLLIIFVLLCQIGMVSCGKLTFKYKELKKENRTILACFEGNNNLSDETVSKSKSLLDGWIPGTGTLLLLSSSIKSPAPVLYKAVSQNGEKKWSIVEKYMGEKISSTTLLSKVINKMQKDFSSESYGLIVFSHATGWLPSGALSSSHLETKNYPTRTLFHEDGMEMSLKDFSQSIPDNCFHFIVFDMCFMGSVEVAYELRNKTKYIMASPSEILSPGFSKAYSNSLSGLFLETPDLKGFAKDFFNYFIQLKGLFHSATISLISTKN